MKRLFVISACVLITVACSSSARSTLVGNVTTEISGLTPVGNNGTWVVEINENGKYTIIKDGTTVMRGRYTVSGSKVTLGHESGPFACVGAQASATYRWNVKAGMLTMKPINESCRAREIVLTNKPLKKTG